jgi:hypothetical protein
MKEKLRAAALALALTLSLVFSLRSWREASLETPNDQASQIARFETVIRAIPATGIIGYFSDTADTAPLPTPPYGIRYAFAPRMLVRYPDQAMAEWVIGDFTKPQDYARAGKQLGLQLVRDFGGGVVLYRR